MKPTSARNQSRPAREASGASAQRTRWRDRWHSYLDNHRSVARDSLRRLLRRPAAAAMTCMVIGIALALPAGLFVALGNVEQLSSGWDGAARISLFLHQAQSEAAGRELAERLGRRDDIAASEYISREQALAEFRRLSGFGEVVDRLDNNPLPAVVVVTPSDRDMSAAATRALYEELAQLPAVEQAQLDLEWIQRLYAMMQLGRRLTLALGALLALGVLLVVANTIKLAIEARRDEIVVVKLVGGTDAFVRRPFLYTGLWYGLGGGLAAWLLVQLSLFWLSGPVANLAGHYQSDYALLGLGLGNSAALWLLAAALGLGGAWVVVGRELRAIEPS